MKRGREGGEKWLDKEKNWESQLPLCFKEAWGRILSCSSNGERTLLGYNQQGLEEWSAIVGPRVCDG